MRVTGKLTRLGSIQIKRFVNHSLYRKGLRNGLWPSFGCMHPHPIIAQINGDERCQTLRRRQSCQQTCLILLEGFLRTPASVATIGNPNHWLQASHSEFLQTLKSEQTRSFLTERKCESVASGEKFRLSERLSLCIFPGEHGLSLDRTFDR